MGTKGRTITGFEAIANCWLAGITPSEMAKIYPEFKQPIGAGLALHLMEAMNLALQLTLAEPMPWQKNVSNAAKRSS